MTAEIDRAMVLAESLRAMHRNAKNAYVSARPGAHHSITMDSTRLGDLSDAADMLEKMAAEIDRLTAPAVLLTDEQMRDCIDSSSYAVCQALAVESMSLIANGKAVS